MLVLNTVGWYAFPWWNQLTDKILVTVLLVGIGILWYRDATYRDELRATYVEVIQTLANTLEQKCRYTHGHSNRVAEYAAVIADELRLPTADIRALRNVARLHDIGKIGVAEAILNKPDRLGTDEAAAIRRHSELGAGILKPLLFLQRERDIVRHHHEWFDGSGYPDGLQGRAVEPLARVLAVADAFDAITSDRPYRVAGRPDEALREIRAGAGTQFDPAVVRATVRARRRLCAAARRHASLRAPAAGLEASPSVPVPPPGRSPCLLERETPPVQRPAYDHALQA
jgi:putative nucleotidyltransferase with HDIG domain